MAYMRLLRLPSTEDLGDIEAHTFLDAFNDEMISGFVANIEESGDFVTLGGWSIEKADWFRVENSDIPDEGCFLNKSYSEALDIALQHGGTSFIDGVDESEFNQVDDLFIQLISKVYTKGSQEVIDDLSEQSDIEARIQREQDNLMDDD